MASLIAPDAATAAALHAAFEMGGIFAGMRLFAANMRRHAVGAIGAGRGFGVALGCIAGAIAGSKIAVWIDRPDQFVALAGTWQIFALGQSIVGALIGGLIGVEIAKRLSGVAASTGDAFVVPLAVGIVVGRIGCFVAGLHDDTYGTATALPWGVDFGDGVRRHPTQLYDMVFVASLAMLLQALRGRLCTVPGLAFKLFLCGYLAWRLLVDCLKPVPFAYPGGVCGLQVLALAALAAYAPFVIRAFRKLPP